MKNFFKITSKIILSMLICSFACFSFSGCGKEKSANKNLSTSVINDTVSPTEQPSAESISDEQENKTNDEITDSSTEKEQIKLNGLYRKTKPVEVEDLYYENLDDVLSFYSVRDINSLHDILRKENFTRDHNSPSTVIDWLYSFNDTGFKKTILNQNGDYFILDGQDKTYAEIFKLEENTETQTITMMLKYIRTSNGTPEETPLYTVITLEKIANSEDLFVNPRTYTLTTDTITINFDKNTTKTNDVLVKLAFLLNINSTNTNDLQKLIIDKIKTFKYQATDEFNKLVVIYNDGGLFNFATLNDTNTYIVNNVVYSLTNQRIDVDSGIETIEIKIIIDNTTSASFIATKW